MRHVRLAALLAAGLMIVSAHAAPTPAETPAKVALTKLNEFIGAWKGPVGSETMSWGWNFKSPEPAIAFEAKSSKHFDRGEFRYLTAKKKYQLTVYAKDAKEGQVFEGAFNKLGYLVLTREDAAGDLHQLTFNTVGDEAERFIYKLEVKPKGRTLYTKKYDGSLTREGVNFGPGAKKPECVVTGGLGTMPVSFKGKTYYVCCSGCLEAFNETPEKWVKAFEAKKK